MKEEEQNDLLARENKALIENVQNRFGIGLYHYKLFISAFFVITSFSQEFMLLSLSKDLVQYEWDIAQIEMSFIPLVVKIGCFTGAIISAIYADFIGRIKICCIGLAIAIFFGLITCFSLNIGMFMAARAGVGVAIGMAYPPMVVTLGESCPSQTRAYVYAFVFCSYCFGDLQAVTFCYFLLPSFPVYGPHEWKILFLVACIPYLLGLISLPILCRESPRYSCFIKFDYEYTIESFNRMSELNGKEDLSYEEEQKILLLMNQEQELSQFKPKVTFWNLKSISYSVFSVLLAIFFITRIVKYGQVYVLPIMLLYDTWDRISEQAMALDMMFSVFLEVPSIIITAFIVEKTTLGRRYTIIILLFLSVIFCYFSSFQPSMVVIWSEAAKLCTVLVDFIIMLYTIELVSTQERQLIIGVLVGAGRIGAALASVLVLMLYDIYQEYVFFVVGLFVLASTISFIIVVKKETKGMAMDSDGGKQNEDSTH